MRSLSIVGLWFTASLLAACGGAGDDGEGGVENAGGGGSGPAPPALVRADLFGGPDGSVDVAGAARDPEGNVYVVGGARGTNRFGSLPPIAFGLYGGGFVAKLTADGTAVWAKWATEEDVTAVAADATGVVFTDGLRVIKYGGDGTEAWANTLSDEIAAEVAAVPGGGWLVGGVDQRSSAPFVSLLADDGSKKGGASLQAKGAITAVAADPAGGVVVAGYGFLDAESPSPRDGVLLAKFDLTFQPVWQKSFLRAGGESCKCKVRLALDAEGRPALATSTPAAVDMGAGEVPATQLLVAAFDRDGGTRWAKALAPTGTNGEVEAIATTASGDVLVGGQIAQAGFTDAPPPKGSNVSGGFFLAVDSGGAPLWWRALAGTVYVSELTPLPSGELVVAGDFGNCITETFDLGGGPAPCADGVSAFVATYGR